jgi:hypothetical protein
MRNTTLPYYQNTDKYITIEDIHTLITTPRAEGDKACVVSNQKANDIIINCPVAYEPCNRCVLNNDNYNTTLNLIKKATIQKLKDIGNG